ncbi:MAG: serine/threonine protein kinase, partial [Myxococcales bacterium]|nr:serine/threonine protein kinase [Myxococcales bacterium]
MVHLGAAAREAAAQKKPDPNLLGQTIDKYRVVGVLGQGGMGMVYEALNTRIQKRVALKFIDAALVTNEEVYARFEREALAASAIDSPHIIQIFDAGQSPDGVPYIVMELLRGQDLGHMLVETGRLPLGLALDLSVQILRGLSDAHAAGIVHRDLKPDNVFLVARGDDPLFVKIVDFGVSKMVRADDVPVLTLTRQGMIVGTPYYMAPEQAQAFPDVDGRADVYSAGAILYECLAARPPHVGRTYEQVIVKICTSDAEDVRVHNPDVPERIARVLARALRRERDERFANAAEMSDALVDAAPEGLAGFEAGVLRQLRRAAAASPA